MAFTRNPNTAVDNLMMEGTPSSGLGAATKGGEVIEYPPREHGAQTSAPRDNHNHSVDQKRMPVTHTTPSIHEDAEERRIVKAVLQGDLVEFQTLVQRYHKPIYHHMYRVMHNVMTAEDLTQETFARAYEKLHTFKVGKRFFPWLYAIAVNLTKDHLRRQRVTDNLFSDDSETELWPDPNGEDCAKKPDCVIEVKEVAQTLEKLPLRYSEPMLLFYREGFSVNEISNALGISSAAVKVRLHRGRKKLMHNLGVGYEKT